MVGHTVRMANLTKRVAKKLADRLDEGETVTVALLVETPGTYGGGAVGLVLAPRVMRPRLEQVAREERADQVGQAVEFPLGSCALVATDQRIIVVLSNGLIFGKTVLDLPLGGLRIGGVRQRLLARQVELVFSDGSSVTVDVQRAQPFKAFVAALGSSGV